MVRHISDSSMLTLRGRSRTNHEPLVMLKDAAQPPVTKATRRFHSATKTYVECPRTPDWDRKDCGKALLLCEALEEALVARTGNAHPIMPRPPWQKLHVGVLTELLE